MEVVMEVVEEVMEVMEMEVMGVMEGGASHPHRDRWEWWESIERWQCCVQEVFYFLNTSSSSFVAMRMAMMQNDKIYI